MFERDIGVRKSTSQCTPSQAREFGVADWQGIAAGQREGSESGPEEK